MTNLSDAHTHFVAAVAEQVIRLQASLARLADEPKAAGVRHAARKLQAALVQAGVEYIDLTGQPYDEGLAVEVIDVLPSRVDGQSSATPTTRGDLPGTADRVSSSPPALPPAVDSMWEIASTVLPIIIWNGAVIRRGEVTLRIDSTPHDLSRGSGWHRALSNRRLAARLRNRCSRRHRKTDTRHPT